MKTAVLKEIFERLEISVPELISLALLEYRLNCHQGNSIRFSNDEETIHRAIYELKNRLQATLYPLQDLHFATMCAYPYSSDLFTDLWILREAGMLTFIHSSTGGSWIERHIRTDSIEYLEEWKQALADHPQILQSFLEFSLDLGNALILPTYP